VNPPKRGGIVLGALAALMVGLAFWEDGNRRRPAIARWPTWKRLASLDGAHPDARPLFQELIAYAESQGMHPQIATVTRTCAEQAVSKARCSWHLSGLALDLALHGSAQVWHEDFRVLGEWWENKGGVWGGRFSGFGEHGDFHHFQWTPGLPDEGAICTDPGCESDWNNYWLGVEGVGVNAPV
jgi:hypothetical protein